MKKIYTIVLMFIVQCLMFNVQCFSQTAPAIQWQKCYGGTNGEGARSIQQTTDGGYIVAGPTLSNDGDVALNHGNKDYWVIKLDSLGNLQWEKTYGGTGYDDPFDIQQTADGGYVVAGWSASNDGDVTGNHNSSDYWIVKIDSSGIIQWEKSLGGSQIDEAFKIAQTNNKGYIVVGISESIDGDVTGNHGGWDSWVLKLDSLGNLEWQKSYGGSSTEAMQSVVQTNDGGYIATGYTWSNDGNVTANFGNADYWTIKLDSSGNLQWQKSFGGSSSELALAVLQSTDGNYEIGGWSESNNGNVTGNHGTEDYWVIKLDSSSNIQWEKSLGGSNADVFFSMQHTQTHGFIIAGYTTSNDSDVSGNHSVSPITDCWIVELDSLSNLLWQKCLGGTLDDKAHSIQQTIDEGYIVAGNTNSNDGDVSGNHGGGDFWIIKLA
ncbi:MAG: T9SS C-terminal target domain-containing protein, partial [Bacteroidota bacterium]